MVPDPSPDRAENIEDYEEHMHTKTVGLIGQTRQYLADFASSVPKTRFSDSDVLNTV